MWDRYQQGRSLYMRRTKRVLIVDDDHDARQALAALLSLQGFSVAIGRSAQEAFGLLSVFDPCVVLSDLSMPGEDGFELLRKLRAMEEGRGRSVAAIAISGHREPDIEERALDAGFDLFLRKPTPPNEIVAAVRLAAKLVEAETGTRVPSEAA
jgi:CheY-like chemotaxis protein